MKLEYDVVVVGGGHAGCEAAAAAANIGSKTLLVTLDMTKFGNMSCNPAIGGIAKGQIVREIDALGGYTGLVTDMTTIQFRMLNLSKGPAMWSPRAQCDRTKFSIVWRSFLEGIENLDLLQDEVVDVTTEKNVVTGIVTKNGMIISSRSVVLTNGTFLNGLIHIGRTNFPGGRMSEPPSQGLTEKLIKLGFQTGRMKTGTPVRIDGRSINFSVLEEQKGDPSGKFSFTDIKRITSTDKSCYITYTNEKVHRILERGFKDSPLYTGTIKGIGPRYCPSIEDKIVTFHQKDSHQLFLEPEGDDTNEYYLNGFSSSLSWDIQYSALRKIKGLEEVKIYRPGYAIEYDYFPPTQLKPSLETKLVKNLFFAGQINGTTGYEEAAAQGLMAGINAAFSVKGEDEFILKRNESYIGVLIDDLVTKGVDEPYRMFTSRAEFRILLRQDNADERLTKKGYDIGIVKKDRIDLLNKKLKSKGSIRAYLETTNVTPDDVNAYLKKKKESIIPNKTKLINIISRPQVNLVELVKTLPKVLESSIGKLLNDIEVLESLEIEIKYSGYIERERKIADKIKRLEEIDIPDKFNYSNLKSLSTEARMKLNKIKPATIGQASRISGVSPSDINILLIHFGR